VEILHLTESFAALRAERQWEQGRKQEELAGMQARLMDATHAINLLQVAICLARWQLARVLLWCGVSCRLLAVLTRPMRVIFQQRNEQIKEELLSKGQEVEAARRKGHGQGQAEALRQARSQATAPFPGEPQEKVEQFGSGPAGSAPVPSSTMEVGVGAALSCCASSLNAP
jgi:hypothetical protein